LFYEYFNSICLDHVNLYIFKKSKRLRGGWMEIIAEPLIYISPAGTINKNITTKTLLCKKPDCGGYCGSEHQRCR
jgi:hypothetical protein